MNNTDINDELYVVPKNTEVFVGNKDDWKCANLRHDFTQKEALFIGSGNETVTASVFVCDECGSVCFNPVKRLKINTDIFARNYSFSAGEGITLLNSCNYKTVSKEVDYEKRRIDEKGRIIDAFLNSRQIPGYQMYDTDYCHENIYAVAFKEGNNFELIHGEKCGCWDRYHILQKHIIILNNDIYGKKRVGLGYICKTCMKMYLDLDYCEQFNPGEYSRYTFLPWPEQRDEKYNIEAEYRRNWFKELRESVPCLESEAEKYHGANITPAIQLSVNTNIQIGNVEGHTCQCDMYRSAFILTDKEGKKDKIGMGYWCPKCRRIYLDSNPYVLAKTKIYSESYTFNEYKNMFKQEAETHFVVSADPEEKLKPFPVKNADKIEIPQGKTVYVGKDGGHKAKKHKIFNCEIRMQRTISGRYDTISDGKYCYDCNKYYIGFRSDIRKLNNRYTAYVFEKAESYDLQYERYLEKLKRDEERNKESQKANNQPAENGVADQSLKNGQGQSKPKEEIPESSRRIEGKDFLVRKTSFACIKNHHDVNEITACLTIIRKGGAIQDAYVPGWYCKTCRCYYISENDYQTVKLNGMIVAQVYTETEWYKRRYSSGLSGFNSESILHKLGYNVGSTENLRKSTRQDIIAAAIDFKILTRREVLDFLDSMINLRGSDPRMYNAVNKWEEDRRFASEYSLNTREYVRVKSLTIKDRRNINIL